MGEMLNPDVCVIGGGSGGLTVAATAAAFGVSVVLIESGKMGGDCLNYGCVPSKALIAAAKQAQTIRGSSKFGVSASEPNINFRRVHDHVHSVIAAIAPNDSVERFTALGVKVIEASGTFKDGDTVVAGEYEIKARRFVIATGSSAFVPPIAGLDEVDFLTNENIFDETRKPGHLIVIGAGPIGMELAQAHRRLGCQVTVVEGILALAVDDPELSAIALDNIRAEGVVIHEQTKVVAVKKHGKSGIRVQIEGQKGGSHIDGTHLLMATGRKPNVNSLGLEKAGIAYNRQGIKVSDKLRTSNRRVYAIGDVTGGLQFTHVAGYHAGLVIRAILFRLPARENRHIIPWCTYTDPEIAHVGFDLKTAKTKFGDIRVLRWPFAENDRAQTERKTTGLIKIITRKNGQIEGVSIVGQNAGEMINMWALAISKKMKVGDIAGYVAPYPTMTEIGKRAATSYYAATTRKPLVRKVIGWLRMFG